ncbi:FHA domain-containing protein FhaB/FipA [Corynebacterium variabile]|uniref:FHA domain-containing protein FhaB/FipA n=1 Tax=Corynebacterium variabile TaxID=1727 RepID=UPI0028A8157F|nr:FHA domain-containing protein [Corynebacterium variabile]
MQSTLVLVVKIGLLVVIWLFIWVAVRAMNRDVGRAATSGAVPVGGGKAAYAASAPAQHRGRGFSRSVGPQSLALTTGPLTGTTLALAGYDEVTVGRSSGCTLVLEDDFASGTHARLIRRGPDWYLEDLDSRNGTFLAGQRIDQPEPLRAGSEFRIGQTTVRMDA